MKTKLVLNSAVSVVVALGLAACSSGGDKKSIDRLQGETQRIANTVDQTVDRVNNALTNTNTTPQAVNPVSRTVALHNRQLDSAAFDKFIRDHMKFSETGELMINGKQVSVNKIYVVDEGKAVDFANYKTNNWRYQTFGSFTSINEKNNMIEGFVSLGNKTAASAIPTKGTVNYTGTMVAKSEVPHGFDGDAKANVVVDVDFSTKMVNFKTENTQLNQKSTPALDLTGSAKLDTAKNEFVDGKVHFTQMPRYVGTLTGAVFGPEAEEVGGTFEVQNGHFIGGFGAKDSKR